MSGVTISLTSGDDSWPGGSGINGGNDSILGLAGNDTIDGGNGMTRLMAATAMTALSVVTAMTR